MFAAGLAYANGGEPIRPIPATPDVDPARAALGERLFHDAQLSKDGTVSCATCHDLASGAAAAERPPTAVAPAARPIVAGRA